MAFETKDIRNSIWLVVQYVVLIGFSFVGLKLSLLAFGKSLFGIWLLLSSIFGFGGAIDFGIGASIVRLVSSKRSDTSVASEFSNSFLIIVFSGLLIMILMIFSAERLVVSNSKLVSQIGPGNLRPTCIVLGGNFFCCYLCNFFRCVFEGLHQFKFVSKISILNSSLQLLAISLIFILKLDILYLAAAYIINSSIQFLIYALSFRFNQNEIAFDFSGVSPKTIGRVLNRNFTLQAVTLLATAIDPIIKYTIGVCSSTSNVSVYEISRRFVVALSGVFSSAFRNTLPKISMLKTRQEYQEFLSLDASHISKLSVIYSVLGFGILAPVFLVISEKFYHAKSTFIVFLILVLVESTNNIGYIYYTYIIGIKRERFLLILQASNVVFTYVFLTLGFKFFDASIGLLGFYLSVLIGSFLIFYFVSNFSGLSFPGILRKSGWKLLLPFNLLTGSNIVLCTLYPNLEMKFQIVFCAICACVLWTPESKELAKKIKARLIR